MQRLIEQPSDEGDLFIGSRRLGRVHYHLAVYQHFSDADESVPANLEIEGRLLPVQGLDLAELRRRKSEVTLRLVDGRLLDLSVIDDGGRIHSTGRGLYSQ